MPTKITRNQNKAIKQYTQLYPEYKKLSQELKVFIKSLLQKANIEFVDIIQRAKGVNSFRAKMIRKNYRNPLSNMKDLCGVRIICSFPDDVKKIEEVLKKNFKISDFKNKEKNISPYKFWYRSHDFEVQLEGKQISRNRYKLLKNFFGEIQVRTVFMDAWAKMEHKINYKHEWNTSHDTKRKLSRLSALLEIADEQLEELAKNKK